MAAEMQTTQGLKVLQGGAEHMMAKSMNEPLTDKILVERAKTGDEIAFSELVNRHYRRALRVAYGLLKDKAESEDVVQDAFTRVHTRLRYFEGSSAFYTWLYRIVVNLSIDTMRRRRRDRSINLDEDSAREALNAGVEMWPRVDDTNPGLTVERQELQAQLEKAFGDLPEIHQAVLFLRELEGLSYEEIAMTLKIRKGTVMSRLFHARRSMQEKLVAQERQGKRIFSGEAG